MLRAVVIDDIDQIRRENIALIALNCPNVTIIGEADSVATGVDLIRQVAPDLVFLDIGMRDGTGFDLLQQFKSIGFKVIFITGFEDFAIKAFRFSAIDYLLKPLDVQDLVEAVKKAEDSVDKELTDAKYNNLFHNFDRPKNQQKLILKTADRIYSVGIQDLVTLQADKNYTTFALADGSKILVSTTLKEYENLLTPYGFFRPHQSHLINMAHFDHFIKSEGGTIVMKNKVTIPLSVRKKESFLVLLSQL